MFNFKQSIIEFIKANNEYEKQTLLCYSLNEHRKNLENIVINSLYKSNILEETIIVNFNEDYYLIEIDCDNNKITKCELITKINLT